MNERVRDSLIDAAAGGVFGGVIGAVAGGVVGGDMASAGMGAAAGMGAGAVVNGVVTAVIHNVSKMKKLKEYVFKVIRHKGTEEMSNELVAAAVERYESLQKSEFEYEKRNADIISLIESIDRQTEINDKIRDFDHFGADVKEHQNEVC